MFNLQAENHGDILFLQFTGDVLLPDALKFRHQLELLVSSPKIRQIVLDLSKAGQIDNACLGVLISLNTAYQNQGRRIVLLSPAPHVLEVMHKAEIEGFFPIFDTEDELKGSLAPNR